MKRRMVAALALCPALAVAPTSQARDGDAAGIVPLARLGSGLPHAVVHADPYVYVGLDSGLATYDVSDPDSPELVAHIYLASPALDIAVGSGFVYVAAAESGLIAVDVADPATPMVAGGTPPATGGGIARGVAVAGSLVFLTEASATSPGRVLRTIDVSDPLFPVPRGSTVLPGSGIDVAVAGSTAWVGVGSGAYGLVAVDVSDPGAPAVVPGGFVATDGPVNGVEIASGLAYLAAGFPAAGALVIADVSVPASPMILGEVALSDGGRGVATRPGVVYVAAGALGVVSFDVSDPTLPVALDAVPTSRYTVGVASRGDVTFLAERSSIETAGLTLVDTVFPSAMWLLGSYTHAEATGAGATAAMAYQLRRDALHVYDTSSPLAPVWLSSWRPPGADFSALAVREGLAAVGEGSTVHLVDLTNPFAPLNAGAAYLSTGVVIAAALDATTLYVATGAGIETFDISSPAAPSPIASFPTAGWAADLVVEGALGYVVAGERLHIIDFSAPASPTEVGSLTIAWEQLYGVAKSGDLVALSGLQNQIYAVDVASPSGPVLEGFLGGGPGFDVVLVGARALVAAASRGVRVVDLTNPLVPVEIGFWDTSGTAYRLANEGEVFMLAALEAQHWIGRCDVCLTGCVESWPTIASNSLRAVQAPGGPLLSWSIGAGAGSSNIHKTEEKTALAALWSDMLTRVGAEPGTNWVDFSNPTSPISYYRIFGAGRCTGDSQDPGL